MSPGGPEDGRKPHLLYVVWGFPPCRAGGVYRALATANAFAAGGWDVTVLTPERETFLRYTGADPALEDQVDPRIEIVRIPFAWPQLETDVHQYSWLRAHSPRVWAKLRKRRDVLRFPEVGYGPWRAELDRAVDRIHADRPVDLTLATANPHVSFAAAWHLHERHGVPYVMDYRDAWTLDVFSGERLHSPKSRAARWEQRLIADATEVWFVNEPIRAWHAQTYPEAAGKLRVVSNGYDVAFAAEGATHEPDVERGLTFGYIGTVTRQVPLPEFVAGWRAARAQSSLVARSRAEFYGYLGHYQTPNPALLGLIEQSADVDVSYRGPAPKTQVRTLYGEFDVLLLVLGAGRYVTSGKVFEYAATGLPIVSVHDLGNAASDVLRDYPLWFPARDLSPDGIAAALIDAAESAAKHDPDTRRACLAFAEQYRRDHQLDPRVTSLKQHAGVSA